jgi:streptogramin lyase
MNALRLILLLGIASALGLHCSKPPQSIAGATDIGNPGTVSGKIVDTTGIAQDSVMLRLLPLGYNPVTEGPAADSLRDTTNSKGEFAIKNVRGGMYTLSADHVRTSMMLRIDTVFVDSAKALDLKTDTLRPQVTVRFTVPDSLFSDSGFVFIPGTQKVVAITAPGTFVLDSVSLPLPPLQYYSVKTGATVASAPQLNAAIADTAAPAALSVDTIPFSAVAFSDIAVDSTGTIWYCTANNGMIRYDAAATGGYVLINSIGKQATIAKPATVWFCDTQATCSYDGTTLSYFMEAAGSIKDLACDTGNTIWFAAQDSILMFDRTLTPGQIVTQYKGSKGITTVFADAAGIVWFGCDSGLIRFDGAFHAITAATTAFPSAGGTAVTNLVPVGTDGRGALIVRSKQVPDSAWTFDGSLFSHFGPPGPFFPNALAIDKTGVLWVAAEQGIFLRNGSGWHSIDLGTAVPQQGMKGVVVDKSGRVWLAGTGGAFMFDGAKWTCFVGKQ